MKRLAWVIGLSFGLATGAFSQYRGMGRGGFVGGGGFRQPSFGHRYGLGFGNVVFPGGLSPLHRPFFQRSFLGRRPFFTTFAYPFFLGGFDYYGDFGYPYPPSQPSVIVVYPPPSAPQVVVQQTDPPRPARPVMHNYSFSSESNSAASYQNQPIVFSIALKDHSVSQALAYGVVDGTLHYIDTRGQQHQTSLGQVDRALSEKLNRAKRIEFGLPPE